RFDGELRHHDECAGEGDRPQAVAFRQPGRVAGTAGTIDVGDGPRETGASSGSRLSAVLSLFGEREFTWHNIHQPNRNLVLEKFPGADGLKTGHTDAAGYGVTASAMRNGQRLILVLNGLRYPDKNDWWAERYRAEEAARILEIAFREF